jgi:anti-sigma factor RsiW
MSGAAGGHPRELLSAYLDDELAVEERMAVDRHLAECEDCRAELSALGDLARAVRDEDVPEAPADLVETIGRRLDAATVLRPRRFRFAVPATIAATIAALGILVTLQWRGGGLTKPASPEPTMNRQPEEQLKQLPTPEAPSSRVEEHAKSDHLLDKDAKEKAAPSVVPDLENENKEESAAGNAPEGVSGGIVGGVAGGVPGGVDGSGTGVAGARERDLPADERRDSLAPAPPPPAASRALAPMAQAPAAKAVAASPCGERWTDSGARGTWDVPDAAKAARELDRIARDLAGRGAWRGVADGRPYQLVVPRGHFEEVFFALRARGVAGLEELPTPPPGDDCLALSIALNER